jgi:ATP-dependent helicase IRC3
LYDFNYYEGLMKVYRQRYINVKLKKPDFIMPNKEDMDMGTLKKYFPAYYEELREYVYQKAYDTETGKYVAAQPSENGEYYSSPYRKLFEIDHIVPISKGGKTIKENLQLLYYKDNRIKGNRT